MADQAGRRCSSRLTRLVRVGLAITGKLARDIAEIPVAYEDMRCVMTLRERLQELAGFTDADFDERDGARAVALVEDPDLGWHLAGLTGRACRPSLAFPIGCTVVVPSADDLSLEMQVEDSGVNREGYPVLILRLPQVPGLGVREWEMAYFCADVDSVVVKI